MESQESWCGKTSQEHFPVTKERTFDAYSKKLSELHRSDFLFLDLRTGDGSQQEASWENATVWPGASWTPNTGECPSAGKESTLSQILEGSAQEKYYLSEKACLGILRRAEKRGKKLPEVLRRALILQAGGGTAGAITLESHPQDSRIEIAKDGIVQTLTGKMGTGGGNVPLVMETPKAYGICSMESNAMKSGNPDSGFYEAETSRTIDCRGGNPGCNQGGMVILDKIPVYSIQGNMIGRADNNGPNGKGVDRDISFTLTAVDRHGVAYAIGRDNVTVWEEKAQTLTAGKLPGSAAVPYTIGNGQVDNLYLDEKARTLDCMHDAQAVMVPQENVEYIVRRLTPLECCRLQGFPDNWTDGLSDENPDKKTLRFWMDIWMEWWALVGRAKGIKRPKDEKAVRRWLKKPESDTELYKMYGNGIALPCAQYVFEGIAEVLGVAGSDTQKGDGEDWTMEQRNV